MIGDHALGSTSILLARASAPEQEAYVGNQSGGRVFLFVATDDFERDHAAMRCKGVRFVREPMQAPYGTVAVFEDLYGNLWDLVENPRRPAPVDGCSGATLLPTRSSDSPAKFEGSEMPLNVHRLMQDALHEGAVLRQVVE